MATNNNSIFSTSVDINISNDVLARVFATCVLIFVAFFIIKHFMG